MCFNFLVISPILKILNVFESCFIYFSDLCGCHSNHNYSHSTTRASGFCGYEMTEINLVIEITACILHLVVVHHISEYFKFWQAENLKVKFWRSKSKFDLQFFDFDLQILSKCQILKSDLTVRFDIWPSYFKFDLQNLNLNFKFDFDVKIWRSSGQMSEFDIWHLTFDKEGLPGQIKIYIFDILMFFLYVLPLRQKGIFVFTRLHPQSGPFRSTLNTNLVTSHRIDFWSS